MLENFVDSEGGAGEGRKRGRGIDRREGQEGKEVGEVCHKLST